MTRYALVPMDATEEIRAAILNVRDGIRVPPSAGWSAMLTASPGGGRVTAEMVEKAAEAYYLAEPWRHNDEPISWLNIGEFARNRRLYLMRAALAALGLQVEGDGQEGEG